jgi:hypothetical protein
MRDAEWARGWGELIVAYPARDEANEQTGLRAGLYRKHLDDLEPAAWLFAVERVIRSEAWFPTVAQLRAHAEAWRPPVLPALPPSEEEREEARAAARRGLELVMAAVVEVEPNLAGAGPVRSAVTFPEPLTVEATDDRLALLRAQAEQIQAAPAAQEA